MKDTSKFKQRFKRWQEGEKVYEAGKILPEPVITPDEEYNQFLGTLPDNQRLTPEWAYSTHRYWELNNKPKNFDEAVKKGMYSLEKDGWHANSVQETPSGDIEFMKPKTHSSVSWETGWYDNLPDSSSFKKNYDLIDDPNRPNFYKYKKRVLPKYDDGTDEEDPPSVKLSREIMSILRGGDFASSRIESGEPGESDALATYLLSRKQLRELFLKHGYIESPKDYGLVKKAVGKRDLPVYQRSKDQIDRLSVIPIGNVDTLWGGDRDDMLVHAGNYPTTIYLDPKTLDLYQKAWDLNDYGPSSGGTATHYGFPKQVAANLLDLIGSPVVVTTGIRKIKYPKQDEFLNLKDNYMKSKGYHIMEDYEDVPLYDMSGKNVIGKFSEKTKRYTLPEITVTAPKKHNSGKSIKPLPKYDGGDNPWIPKGTKVVTLNSEPISAKPKTTVVSNLVPTILDIQDELIKLLNSIMAGMGHIQKVSQKEPVSGTDPIGETIVEGIVLDGALRGLGWLGKTAYNAALPTLGRITKPYTNYFAAKALSNSIDNAASVTTFPKVLPNYEQPTNVIDRELPIRSNIDLLRKADFDLPQIDRSYMNSVYNNRFSQGAQHYAAVDPTDASYVIKYDRAGKNLDELKNYIGSLKILNQYDDVVVPQEFIGQIPTGTKDWAGKDLFRGFYRQKRIYPIDEQNVMSAYYNNWQKFKKLESLGKKSHKVLFDTHKTKGPDIVIPEGRIGDFTFEHNIGVDQNGKPKIFDPMLFIDVPQKYRDAPSSALEFDYIKDYNDFIKLSALHNAINLFDKGKSIHIKPSHRGRLTALKKRTGKSEAELYNDGNPAHKKMVVFARNARRWKH